MSDTRNVKLGVCSVTFDGADLGYTKGGVEVTVATETYKSTVDQFGRTVINEPILGREVKVKCPLAETTLDNLVSVMPGATLVADGAKEKVHVAHGAGTNLLSVARTLILHPTANAAAERNDDFVLLLAATGGALQFAYKLDEERIFPVEFSGYPSSVTNRLFAVGDLMAGAQACTVDETTDVVTANGHGFVTGQAVVFDATAFPIASMVYGKTYFVKVLSANTFSVHPTAADALAGTNGINFTSAGTAVEVVGL